MPSTPVKFKVTINAADAERVWMRLVDQRMEQTKQLVRAYGGQVHVDTIRLTPVKSGDLKASWRLEETDSGYIFTVRVSSDLAYAAHVEFGTRPHKIRVKNASVLTDGVNFFGTEVNHPGTTAQPMLRPSVDGGKDQFVRDLKTIWNAK